MSDSKIKQPDFRDRIHQIEIKNLETKVDEISRQLISELFDKEKDPIAIIKWKEIYGRMEAATDRCEDIANIIESAGTMAVATAFGGWKIVKTIGLKMTKLTPIQGFAAELSSAATIPVASQFGIPLSTTHTIGTAIMGVGAHRRFSAVRWGVAGNVVLAWILTFPVCGLISYLVTTLIKTFTR